MQRFVSYYRVSTDKQGVRGLGIEAQKAAVAQYVSAYRGELLAEYVEVESGKRVDPPGDVTSATLEAYLRHRAESRGGPNIRADVREVARQWNKMRLLVAGWPDTALALGPPEGRVQALPLSAYPAGLQAGIEHYLADTLRSLAVHCGLTGEADARFRRMLAAYRPKPQREITEELSKLLDRLADPEVEARLLHLPQLLMHKARRRGMAGPARPAWTTRRSPWRAAGWRP